MQGTSCHFELNSYLMGFSLLSLYLSVRATMIQSYSLSALTITNISYRFTVQGVMQDWFLLRPDCLTCRHHTFSECLHMVFPQCVYVLIGMLIVLDEDLPTFTLGREETHRYLPAKLSKCTGLVLQTSLSVSTCHFVD